MGEGTWEYIVGAILIFAVLILVIFIAFPKLNEGKSDVMDIYRKVFDLERPEEEVLKEKSAVNSFNNFLEQISDCLEIGETDCTCDFDLNGLDDYGIWIDETSNQAKLFLKVKDGTIFSEQSRDWVFGVADKDGCGLIGAENIGGYRSSILGFKGDKILLKFINENGKSEEKTFNSDFSKLYVKKLPRNNQLCFIIGDYDKYKNKISCEDVPKKKAIEEHVEKVINDFLKQIKNCLNKEKSECACKLDPNFLDNKEYLKIEYYSIIKLFKEGEGQLGKKNDDGFKFKLALDQGGEINCIPFNDEVEFRLSSDNKFSFKDDIYSDFLIKNKEIYISDKEDKNTICFLREGGKVPPVC